MLPQDVGDPMYTDSILRRDVLLAHIARQRVSSDDILRRSIVVMANNNTAQISRQGGKYYKINTINHLYIIYYYMEMSWSRVQTPATDNLNKALSNEKIYCYVTNNGH